jgi:hypothetical protein
VIALTSIASRMMMAKQGTAAAQNQAAENLEENLKKT